MVKNAGSSRTGSGDVGVPALRQHIPSQTFNNSELQSTYFNQSTTRTNKNEPLQHENYSARSQNKASQGGTVSVQLSNKQSSRDRRVDRSSGLAGANGGGANNNAQLSTTLSQGGQQRGMVHSNTTASMNN